MKNNMLSEFIKKNDRYLGELSIDENKVGQYNQVCFVNRNTQECIYYELKAQNASVQFIIPLEQDPWSDGIWDAFLVPSQEKQERLPLDMDPSNYSVTNGVFSLDSIHYVDQKKVYIPFISKIGALCIKVGNRRNNKISYDSIFVTNYEVVDDVLNMKGIIWPNVKSYEMNLVVESSDSTIRWHKPMTICSDYSCALAEVKQIMHANDSFQQWNIWIEMNRGNVYMRYSLILGENTINNESYPLTNAVSNNASNKDIVLHSKVGRELRFACDTKVELLRKYSFGLLEAFDMKKNRIKMSVRMDCFGGKPIGLQIKQFRGTQESFCDFSITNVQETGRFTRFDVEVDLCKVDFNPFYWNFFIVVELDGEEVLSYLKNNSRKVFEDVNRKLIRYTYELSDKGVVFPCISKTDNFTVLYREKCNYDSAYFKLKETFAVWIYSWMKAFFKKRKIWLVCEKYAETAQDNGYYFFDYCFKEQKEREVYYIIKKDSVDYQRIRKMKKRVIPFMSLKHMIYLQAPVVMVSSESRAHYYIWRTSRGRIKGTMGKHPYVFLQHGVIGLKKVDQLFRKSFMEADLFVTSSDFEKKIIIDNYGYKQDEVIVTGLARWDAITNQVSSEGPREVILMPTWRNWLEAMGEEEFLQTDYYKTYADLIGDARMENYAEQYNLKINFIIHPKLKQYVGNFSSKSENVQVYQFDEVPINELLMRASLLITDYSSVAWEMYYSKKPVVFFRFDVEQYEESQGAYLDLKQEIIGEVTENVEDLLKIVAEYAESGFVEKNKFALERNQYFNYMDGSNAKRIYDAVEKKFGV